ncbi:hypothetical protein CIK05_09830 [Bdellovibrio sp. qaytius]|nr:hypothetical protein CIK05_09830 [Bdellovibrio sp. qaytius]
MPASIKSFLNIRFLLVIVSAATIAGCASFLSQSEETKSLLRQGQMTQALKDLKEKSDSEGKDQLMYTLDYAMALQIAGDYKNSATTFIKADSLLEQKDYHSISQIVGSTLGAEEMIQYKGESYEKFLLNSMNAINYLMLGDFDAALVECRRINSKISTFKMEGRDAYELSPFASYLSGIIWESQNKYDDAYIEYESAYKLDPSIAGIGGDLIRTARLAGRDQTLDKWKKTFKSDREALDEESNGRKNGEVVVIFQQGFGAKKVPRSDEPRFPTLKTEFLNTSVAQVEITPLDSSNGKTQVSKSRVVYDIDRMAMITLDKDYSSLVARRIGGVAAKAVMSDQIRQKNELLGGVAWIAMNIADRADLRQWSTLPSKIQMARIFLKPGKYDLKVLGLDSGNAPTADALPSQVIEIKAGKKVFVNFRSLR